MPARPRTIDEYLAGLSDDKRAALERVRKAIKAAAPKAEECFSYGLPAFRLGGKVLPAGLIRKLVKARIAENAG